MIAVHYEDKGVVLLQHHFMVPCFEVFVLETSIQSHLLFILLAWCLVY